MRALIGIMTAFILRRILLLPFVLLGDTLLVFAMLQFVSPAERSSLYVRSIPHNAQELDSIVKRYGLDDPLWVQYWHWLVGRIDPNGGSRVGGILRGDFGYSRTAAQPVADLITRRFPATVELTLFVMVPTVFLGIWMGVVAAVRHNSVLDQALRAFGLTGSSLPSFVVGLLLLMGLYAQTGWFPPGRLSDWAQAVVHSSAFHTYTSLITLDALLNGRLDVFLDALRHLCLPVTTLAYASLAVYLRVVRASMLDTLPQLYIAAARAKGLPARRVIYCHALRNALIPATTLGGFTVAALLGGVVVVETIFEYPGLGEAAAQAAMQFDVITVLALTLLGGVMLVLANLAVDVLYTLLDPRVRLE